MIPPRALGPSSDIPIKALTHILDADKALTGTYANWTSIRFVLVGFEIFWMNEFGAVVVGTIHAVPNAHLFILNTFIYCKNEVTLMESRTASPSPTNPQELSCESFIGSPPTETPRSSTSMEKHSRRSCGHVHQKGYSTLELSPTSDKLSMTVSKQMTQHAIL
ncbi:hypothetical protein GQ43DRAFT_431071 [Delitschia confertaspora ATCC 74209]|uniref:Uncharacterized protein n=1 Tax=Delitschia confertaspora ATCC 74209 TaxID=1513339 RepID=A0A9P4MTH1_9PLEO|nr:hypothetical protein GQ43DRAFT_431071 [Delitschia confertaspora ATCC 74209]